MSELTRLQLLTRQMHLEHAEDTHCPQLSRRKQDEVYVSNAMMPNGQRISLLKTLLTSVCERNCFYCPFRSGRDMRRASFSPDQFSKLFMYMHANRKVEGLFLSSGVIGGGIRTQDSLLDTAMILRKKYDYQGYLHLKIMPGAEREQVKQAMLLADRVSINLEAPNTERLKNLAPKKHFTNELIDPLRWVQEIRKTTPAYQAWKGTWPSTVTQFVVGGAGENDIEILLTTKYLHQQLGLARAYFSGFNPVPNTPLENKSPTPLVRQNRLYQASFLLRDYGFSLEELPFSASGDLPLDVDPKLAWANHHFRDQPVEINQADKTVLLRIPGIGPKGAQALLRIRRGTKIRSLSTLTKLGIRAKRAAPFILLDGQRPFQQLALF